MVFRKTIWLCLFLFILPLFPRTSFALVKGYCASLVFNSADQFLPFDLSKDWKSLHQKIREIEKYYHYLVIRIRYFKKLSETLKGDPRRDFHAWSHFIKLPNQSEVSRNFEQDEKRILSGQLDLLLQETEKEFQKNFNPPILAQAEVIQWLYQYSPSYEVFDALDQKMKEIQIPLQKILDLLESYRFVLSNREEGFQPGYLQSKYVSTFQEAKKHLWFSCLDQIEALFYSIHEVYSYNGRLNEKGWLNDIDAKTLSSAFQNFLNEYAEDLGGFSPRLRKFKTDTPPDSENFIQEMQNELTTFKDEHGEIVREISNKRIEIWNFTLEKIKNEL